MPPHTHIHLLGRTAGSNPSSCPARGTGPPLNVAAESSCNVPTVVPSRTVSPVHTQTVTYFVGCALHALSQDSSTADSDSTVCCRHQ